ncbi:hypothetical protein SARC_06541 [Sphaeroforma arctica JP610]|uniref:Uncharacterized protein n=1 Tax=Sphaeroforma arctica JP610 TaxID=667725 RepID=A0A0L0FX45_9EUKA|nr:hypothetical protein SARC_06541 [Sphaeroforma arctica JP610]KNC81116.1 hypothetical protein SARC_06541 [Sphaeroforma arctica JP610]|eukprot:XP_014155018.1 hypothetical protein SARC_06541 [Sphaeroforma arctica JP610]
MADNKTRVGKTRACKPCTCKPKTAATAVVGGSSTTSSIRGLSASTIMYIPMPSDGAGSIVMLDGDDSASEVAKYKAKGFLVAGYISARSWEDWRDDKSAVTNVGMGKRGLSLTSGPS